MPKFIMPKGDNPRSFDSLAPFMRGYVEAMFFTNTGTGDDEELEDATFADLAPETVARIATDCDTFEKSNAIVLQAARARCDYDDEQAGRDFWFTRCGHGVGFWDRPQLMNRDDKIGEILTDACRAWPSLDLCRGDDGRVYLA